MRIYKMRTNRMIIEFSAKELKDHALCAKTFRSDSQSPRTLFYIFLPEIIKSLGSNVANIQKVNISVFENETGGCLLLLHFQKPKANTSAFFCKLFHSSDIFSLAKALFPLQKDILKSKLFLDSEKHYIVYVSAKSQTVRYVLSEFGTVKVAGLYDMDFCSERTKLLCDDFIQSLTL